MELEKYEKPLTVREEKRLAELEQIIQDNFLGFVAVGQALAEIRDARLYRISHRSFEDYCRDIWDMAHQRADQLIVAKGVIENLTADDNHGCQSDQQVAEIIIPQNERQARELARLDPADQRRVWLGLVQAAREMGGDDGPARITAGVVKKAVKSFIGERFEEVVTAATREARENRTDFASEEFTEAYLAFLQQIDIERRRNWRYTSRKTAHKHLQALTSLVAEAGANKLETGCAMELADREKLKKAGFRIFRMNAKHLLIEEFDRHESWVMVAEFETPAQLSATFKELLKADNNLRA